jgi:predicted N-acetyltransferase YhbS
MELVEFGRLTAEQRAQLEGDESDPFGGAGDTLVYRPKERHVALSDGGRLVASTGRVSAEVEVAGERFPVVGIGGVIVNAAFRGRGLARRVVEEALARARTEGPDFALLFCFADRAGLYEKLGFVAVDAPVSVEQPDGSAQVKQLTMWRALREGAVWPAGPVTIRSHPF